MMPKRPDSTERRVTVDALLNRIGPSALILILLLVILLLPSCGDSAATDAERGDQGSLESPSGASAPVGDSTATTLVQIPSPTSTSSDEYSCWWGGEHTNATVMEIEAGSGWNRILVIEHPEDPYAGEQRYASITADTRIIERTVAEPEARTFEDLQVGQRVTVTFCGAIEGSYPGHGTADQIAILRTHTDGPADPTDMITMTFTHSLFLGAGDAPPRDDNFYVSYSDADGVGGELYVCGDDPRAPRLCTGPGGATYEVQAEIPRGTELTYTVYRVSSSAPDRLEVVKHGREILDADTFVRSHYRYGAANPSGYD